MCKNFLDVLLLCVRMHSVYRCACCDMSVEVGRQLEGILGSELESIGFCGK